MSKHPKKIHIIGVCGTAMGQLAGLLKGKGFDVSGSDQQCYPPVSTMIEELDIDLHIGNFQKENVNDADLIIVGNVVREHNPETVFAREQSIQQISMPEALAKYVFEDAKRLVVAGTHGKTTTAGLLAHVFEVAGKNPGYMIGGISQGKTKGYSLGNGEYAIFEGDEYDTCYFDKRPKFLHYNPYSAIITSLELDHLDIFENIEDYTEAFNSFAKIISKDGFLFINDSYKGLEKVASHSEAEVYTYGDKESSDFRFNNLKQEGEFQIFDLIFQDELLGIIKTALSGKHNIANIVAVAGLAHVHGLAFSDIQKAVESFTGMKRRQEIIYNDDKKGVIVMDDFAHHPTAVKTTVAGIKSKYPNNRLIALYEPTTRSSRKKMFEQNYIEAFDGADIVYFKMPKLGNGEQESEVIDGEVIVNSLETKEKKENKDSKDSKGIEAHFYTNTGDLLTNLISDIKENDLVLIMSHGEFDKIRIKLIEQLKML